MNPSNFGDLKSGFSITDRIDRNWSFNSAPVPKSSSRLTRPRLVKMRKQVNSQNLKPSGTSESLGGSDYNPFRSPNSNSYTSLPGLGQSGNEAFLFGANVSGIRENLNSEKFNSNLETGSRVVEGMRNLRLENENGSGKDYKHNFSFDKNISTLPEDLKTLNIKDPQEFMHNAHIRDTSLKYGVKNENNFLFTSVENVGSSFGKRVEDELSNELNSDLKILGRQKGDDGSNKLNANETRKFVIENSIKSHDSLVESSGHVLQESMKKLNIKDSMIDSGTIQNKKSDEVNEKILSEEMRRKLNVGNIAELSCDASNLGCSSSQTFRKNTHTGNAGEKNAQDFVKPFAMNFSFPDIVQGEKTDPINFHGMPSTKKTVEFSFSSKPDNKGTTFMEFRTPDPKQKPFSSLNQKVKFNAKKEAVGDTKLRRKREKLKQPVKVQLNLGQDFVFKENVFSHDNTEASDSYSPMDISPYQETQNSSESFVVSDESFSLDKSHVSADSASTASNGRFDEDLVAATERMDINEVGGVKNEEVPELHSDKGVTFEDVPEDSASGAETESFKSAGEEMEASSETFVTAAETEVSSSLKLEIQENEGHSPSNSVAASSSFTFTASSGAQGSLSAPKRYQKKKNLIKLGNDSYNFNPSMGAPQALPSSAQFSSFTSVLSHLSSGKPLKRDTCTSPCKAGVDSEKQKAHEAQKACDKWRLRGNHAYTSGDLSKAEDCYTQGINSISETEMSRSCLRALVLCYSNRAAARISLGRIREALGDCTMAASIDPNFLRVQCRAGNCYLALGEIEDASRYFKRCLQAGSDVCVDRKITVEASEGLQKVQKISECVHQAAGLLQLRTSNDAEEALEVLTEALSISSFSEMLLEMKAEALFMLQMYEKVIKMCEETFHSAEKNSPSIDTNCQLGNLDCPDVTKVSNFRNWRCRLIVKSYFHLGKLEDAISSLEKQERFLSVTERDQNKNLESSIALAATIRELLRLKYAGNEAFQSGRHTEAVEHYTAALSCNVESRPFTAVCFCNRAAAYKALSQIVDAIADCSLAIALDGNYLKAISRRATLFEMIRDYGQAANDVKRLVDLLTRQIEEKTSQLGAYDRSTSLANDLRQARVRLSELEENSRKGITLDMYLVLGVEPSSSASDVRKAYRKAALRHHPDKAGQSLSRNDNGDDRLWKEIGEEVHRDADRLFKMIGEAYAVLSDPAKRSQYDLEEEMRKDQKKRDGSSTSRAYDNAQNYHYPFERSGSRRNWREAWRSHGNPGTARF